MNICNYPSSYLTAGESEEMAQEDFQYKLKVYIDSTVDKRFVLLNQTCNWLFRIIEMSFLLPAAVWTEQLYSPSSAKTRQGALDGLKTAMATKILYEFISERRMTITDSIERCLKKGWFNLWLWIIGNKRFSSDVAMTSVQKVELAVCMCKPGKGVEQCAAASLACLLCIQLGSGIESEEVFKTLKPVFKTILNDGSANIQARQAVNSCVPLLHLL